MDYIIYNNFSLPNYFNIINRFIHRVILQMRSNKFLYLKQIISNLNVSYN